jgi:hypothetical protein
MHVLSMGGFLPQVSGPLALEAFLGGVVLMKLEY